MKRALAGLGSLLFLLLATAFVVPLLLPKDAIRDELVSQIEERTGWRLRLDGPVGLSLLPGFRMSAENVGIAAGGAGEILRAGTVDFGLAWQGLFGGDIRLTHVRLDAPVVSIEIDEAGRPNWAAEMPARAAAVATNDTGASTSGSRSGGNSGGFPADRWSAATQAIADSNGETAPQTRAATVAAAGSEARVPAEGATPAIGDIARDGMALARIGVDRLEIAGGRLIYSDRRDGTRHEADNLNLVLSLPSLSDALTLEGGLGFRGVAMQLAGTVAAPMRLANGGASAVDLTLSAAGAQTRVVGEVAPQEASRLRITAEGKELGATLAAFGTSLPREPGAYRLSADVAASPETIEISALEAQLAGASLRSTATVALAGEPEVSGRLEIAEARLETLLALAGRGEEARGTLGGSLRFAARGADTAALLGSLDASGRLSLAGGGISGLSLPSPIGDDAAARRIEDLAVAIDFAGLDAPVSVSGGLTWRGDAFRIEGSATPALAMAGMPTPLTLRLAGSQVAIGYEGSVAPSGSVDGNVVLETRDLRALAAWLGTPLAPGGGLGPFSFSGRLAAGEQGLRFTGAQIRLDDTTGRGEGELRLGARPKLTARLELDRLGLDPYRAATDHAGSGRSEARVPGAEGSSWSRVPIDLSGLKALDAELSLSARQIVRDTLEIGPSRLDLKLADGRLSAELAEMALYGGQGSGVLVIDGSQQVPELAARFTLSDLSARPFLTAIAGFGWIEGRVTSALDVRTRGISQYELVSGLDGTARFDFADGAIRGINIPRMVRGLTVDTLLGWASNETQKTDFSALGASFAITRGIAATEDLALIGPLVRMSGTGRVDMPERMLDWRLEPRVVPSLEGGAPVPLAKGEARELEGLGVPVIVRGSWDRPQIYPDIKGILENPQAALKQLESLGGGLFKSVQQARSPREALTGAANEAISRATGGNTTIDVQKVLDGKVDDQEVLEAVEQGFGLPSGFLGSFGIGRRQRQEEAPQEGAPIE